MQPTNPSAASGQSVTVGNPGTGPHPQNGATVERRSLNTRTTFDGDYPGFSFARVDNRFDVSVNLTKRDFQVFGMAPMVQYTFTHNNSNVPLHDYDAHGLALTLTKKF